MSNPKDKPDQRMEAENPDEPTANVAPLPELVAVYSMQGYPPLPTIDYDGDLRQQAVFYNELAQEVEDRLQREIVEGCQLLAEIGMSEEEFRAQYGAEFQNYQFATSEYECIVPGTQMTALYIEFIRLFIALLIKESKRREDREMRAQARLLASDTDSLDSHGFVLTNPGTVRDVGSPGGSTSSSDSLSGSSLRPSDNIPIHRDPDLHRMSNSASSFDSFSGEIILASLKDFFNKLTLLDPATTEFLIRLQALMKRLESQYSTAEESVEHTSADVSDLTEDSRSVDVEGGAVGSAQVVPPTGNTSNESNPVLSEESMHGIANLPEDEKSEAVEEEETGV